MERSSHKVNLVRTAFFKKVGGEVYVRNVATGEEFIFSGEAAPIFSLLRRGALRKQPLVKGNIAFIRDLTTYGLIDTSSVCGKTNGRDIHEVPHDDACKAVSGIAGHFQEIRRRRHKLWSAGLELTYRCNARCRHCYIDIPKEQSTARELTDEEWMSVVDQLARMGCMNVLVTGGEPTLHSAFLSVCKRIIKRGMLCDVYTNGLDIPDDLFGELCKLPLNSISVSLYSGTDAFHDTITGVHGSFQKTLATLLGFKEAGVDAYAKVPVFHKHLDDFFAAKELGRKHGFRVMASTILVPGHSGKTRNPMMMNAAEYRTFLEREAIPDTCVEMTALTENYRKEPWCQAGLSTLCISPFGDVMPCNSFPRICGDVRKMPLSQIWRTSTFLQHLRQIRRCDVSPRCATCNDIAYCTVCLGASWNETRGQIAPCSWSCEQTHVRAAFNRKPNNRKRKNDKNA